MTPPEIRQPFSFSQPATFALWTVGVLVFSIVARIGWEVGAKLWSIF